MQYSSFDDALRLITEQGQGAWLAKSDLENAFCMIPMNFESITPPQSKME